MLVAVTCKFHKNKQFYTGNSSDFEKYEFLNVSNPFEGKGNKEPEVKIKKETFIPLSVPSIQGNEWKYIKECLSCMEFPVFLGAGTTVQGLLAIFDCTVCIHYKNIKVTVQASFFIPY